MIRQMNLYLFFIYRDKLLYAVAQNQPDTLFPKLFFRKYHHIRIERGEDMGNCLHQRNFHAPFFEIFCCLDADKPAADHHSFAICITLGKLAQ